MCTTLRDTMDMSKGSRFRVRNEDDHRVAEFITTTTKVLRIHDPQLIRMIMGQDEPDNNHADLDGEDVEL